MVSLQARSELDSSLTGRSGILAGTTSNSSPGPAVGCQPYSSPGSCSQLQGELAWFAALRNIHPSQNSREGKKAEER